MTTKLIGSGAGQVGRYFTVVSVLPATVFVLYVYLLASTAPWSGPIRWSALADVAVENVVIAAIGALVLALALNPLQLTLIQLLEGYWGASRLAVELASIRTSHHQRRSAELESRTTQLPHVGADPVERLRTRIAAAESQRALGSYPKYESDFLPTRLGNVLRRYETTVGKPYGLVPLLAIPRLVMVGDEREVGYVRDQRVQLELATRISLLAAVAVPVTLLLMWNQGLWLLLAFAPYGVAFLTYRGAVAIAHEYGTSLAVLTELSRFELYRRLHLPHPSDTIDERAVNQKLMEMFKFTSAGSMRYEKPQPSEDSAQTTSGPATAGGEDPEE